MVEALFLPFIMPRSQICGAAVTRINQNINHE
jgi:hypothetical protein